MVFKSFAFMKVEDFTTLNGCFQKNYNPDVGSNKQVHPYKFI